MIRITSIPPRRFPKFQFHAGHDEQEFIKLLDVINYFNDAYEELTLGQLTAEDILRLLKDALLLALRLFREEKVRVYGHRNPEVIVGQSTQDGLTAELVDSTTRKTPDFILEDPVKSEVVEYFNMLYAAILHLQSWISKQDLRNRNFKMVKGYKTNYIYNPKTGAEDSYKTPYFYKKFARESGASPKDLFSFFRKEASTQESLNEAPRVATRRESSQLRARIQYLARRNFKRRRRTK